jgi:hypothetical protein
MTPSARKEVEMKGRIRLVEEVSPSEVIPEEEARQTLWTAPPPTEVRWWVDGSISEEDLARAGLPYACWDRETLEEFDMFFDPPGLRVFGANAPEILRDLGYEVEVVTKEELRRTHERLLAERERRERERLERQERRARRMERLHAFAEAHGLLRLSDVEDAFGFFDGQPRIIPYEVWYTGNTGRLHFGRSRETGRLLLVLDYGNTCLAFADPVTFDAICEARWRRLTETFDPHEVYFWCLVKDRFYSDCLGAEWAKWVVERKAGLLETLRRDYVVVARSRGWSGYDAEQARQVCEELGIEFRISRNHHGVFRKDRLPKDL